jgi:membrane protease YdiL (CAAX protease family)
MNKYVRFSSARTQLSLFLILFGFFYILAVVLTAAILGAATHGKPGPIDLTDPSIVGVSKALQVLSSVVIFLLPSIAFVRLTYREHPAWHLGLRPADKANFYLIAILVLLFSFPFEGWLGQLNKMVHLPDWMNQMEKDTDKQLASFFRRNSNTDIVINMLVIAVIPGICEEALFRGVLQPILIRLFRNPWAGIVVAALFFSAFHFQFQGFLPRAFLGILLGAVYWYSNSLWTAILAHFFVNGIQVLAVVFYPKMVTDNPSVPLYAALISIVIVVGLLSAMRRQSTVTYAGMYGKEDRPEDYPR